MGKNKIRGKLQSQNGMTLVEVIVSFALITLVLLVLATGILTATNIMSRARLSEAGGLAANKVLEENGRVMKDGTLEATPTYMKFKFGGENITIFTTLLKASPKKPDGAVTMYSYDISDETVAEQVMLMGSVLVNYFYSLTNEQRKEEFGQTWMTNDQFRQFYMKKYGDATSFPKFPDEMLIENGLTNLIGADLQIQPYLDSKINEKAKTQLIEPSEVVIFAKTGSKNGWYCNFVYNQYDRSWYYKKSGASINSDNYIGESIKATLISAGWVKLNYPTAPGGGK